MPAWSFRSRFRAPLSNGLAEAGRAPPPYPEIRPKRQTIRARRADGRDPEPGARVNLWIAQRTPGRIFLGTTPPIRRLWIRIPHVGDVQIEGLGAIAPGSVTRLARRDGFVSAREFFAFLEADHGFPFDGFLSRW
jgi:hypothetical protein